MYIHVCKHSISPQGGELSMRELNTKRKGICSLATLFYKQDIYAGVLWEEACTEVHVCKTQL